LAQRQQLAARWVRQARVLLLLLLAPCRTQRWLLVVAAAVVGRCWRRSTHLARLA
jgi:hypothetical protein